MSLRLCLSFWLATVLALPLSPVTQTTTNATYEVYDRIHGLPKRHGPFRGSKWKSRNRRRAGLRHGRLHVHHGWKHRFLTQPDHTLVFQVGLASLPAHLCGVNHYDDVRRYEFTNSTTVAAPVHR